MGVCDFEVSLVYRESSMNGSIAIGKSFLNNERKKNGRSKARAVPSPSPTELCLLKGCSQAFIISRVKRIGTYYLGTFLGGNRAVRARVI